jgi:Tol biopolymer transport system component
VLFASNRGGRGAQIWRQRADGSTPAESVLALPGQLVEAQFSPDGRWLVFRRNQTDGNRDLFGMRLGQDSAPVPLVASRFNEYSIALSPDGRWLAYTSDESGQPEVYVRPFPATSEGRWQVSNGGGSFPRWAHSGRELFFESAGDFMVAAVIPGATFASSEPKRLFGGMGTLFVRSSSVPYWDVARDDQHFLMMKVGTTTSATNQIVAIDNWLGELEARMGTK